MMEYLPFAVLFFGLLYLLIRPISTLFHELGHAIPTILMTKKPVSIYIGSYGDARKSLHFKIGLLDVWFSYHTFSWWYGLCVPSANDISINKQILSIFTGPITSFSIAAVSCYLTFAYDNHGFLKLVFVIFLFTATIDLFANLIPRAIPVKLNDGRLIYNDGYQIMQLLNSKRFITKYERAAELYLQHKFAESATAFYDILQKVRKEDNTYRMTIRSYFLAGNYQRVKEVFDEFVTHGNVDSDDYANAGHFNSLIGEYDVALGMYNASLEMNPNNKYSLNNKGFTFNLLSKFEEAIVLFDKAMEVDSTFSYTYSNRGLAKIKLGRTEEGLEDIYYALKLNEGDSYGYRSLGIYHLDRREYSDAQKMFKKAKELDTATYKIDELINEAAKWKFRAN
jgi:tetratricopeptide (TPR) repeat protein